MSQSKMPPQQGDSLLDVFDGAGDFGTHLGSPGADIGSVSAFVKPRDQ
jgi:hypothetical protein